MHGPHIIIPTNYQKDAQELIIRPIGDIHLGNPGVDMQFLHSVIDEIKRTPEMYWIGVGDYVEMNGKANSHDGVFTDNLSPQEQLDLFIHLFEPIAHKCLAMITGNHDARVKKEMGIDPLLYPVTKLGLENIYQTESAIVKLKFGKITKLGGRREPGGNKQCCYDVFVSHGTSSTTVLSGKLAALEKTGDIVIADVYITGHTHSPIIYKDRRYVSNTSDTKQVGYRDRLFVNTGSFLEYNGYALTTCLSPVAPSCPYIYLDGTREKTKVMMS